MDQNGNGKMLGIIKPAHNIGLNEMAGTLLGGRSVDFLNYCLSRQRKVVASNSATSLTRNVMRDLKICLLQGTSFSVS